MKSVSKHGCRTILSFAGIYYFHVTENKNIHQMLQKKKTIGDVTEKKKSNLYYIYFATQATNWITLQVDNIQICHLIAYQVLYWKYTLAYIQFSFEITSYTSRFHLEIAASSTAHYTKNVSYKHLNQTVIIQFPNTPQSITTSSRQVKLHQSLDL